MVPYLFKCVCLVAAGKDVLNGVFTAEVPVGEFLRHSELVVEYGVSAVIHGAVCPFEQLIAPFAFAHVGNHEGAGVVIAQGGALAGKLVVLGKLPAGVVFVGYPSASSVAVKVALNIYQAAIVVEQEAVSHVAVLLDSLFPCRVAALGVIYGVVGVSVVHSFLPPAECQYCIATD